MNAFTELKEKYKLGALSQSEFLLISVAMFCIGLVIGLFISPKGNREIGSNNGNNNGNNSANEAGKAADSEGLLECGEECFED